MVNSKCCTSWLLALFLAIVGPNANAATFLVSTGGNGSGGATWNLAFTNLQAALNAATSGSDQILVAGGTYPTYTQIVWTAAASGVSIIGGYEGSGTPPGNRDPATWPTILTRTAATTNRIFYIAAVTNGSLTGVTVTNGYARPPVGSAHPLASGGGLYLSSCVNFLMDDCRVIFNHGYDPTLNGGEIYGGGVFMAGSSVTLNNCVVSSNLVDAIDTDNMQTGNGAGLALYSGTCWMSNCVIVGNYAKGGYMWAANKGGALYLNGTATVRNTVIKFNDSDSSLNYMGQGDGVYVGPAGNVRFENCLIADNHGSDAGVAFWQVGGKVSLVNCTIATNKNYGIYCSGGTVAVTNSILWANGDDVYEVIPGSVVLAYSDISDGTGNGVNGCVGVDPLFVDTTYFHLQSRRGNYIGGYFSGGSWVIAAAYSPLLDAGDPASAYSLEPKPNGNRIDMGAYGNTSVASLSSAAMGTVFVVH